MGLKVVAVDVNDDMLEIVKKNGADAIFNSRTNQNYGAEIKKLTGSGCHGAAIYSNASPAYASARKILKMNGLLMAIGLPEKPLEFPAFEVVCNFYRIKGANTGTPKEMKKAVDFTAKHNIVPEVDFRKLEEMYVPDDLPRTRRMLTLLDASRPQMVDEMEKGEMKRRSVVLFE